MSDEDQRAVPIGELQDLIDEWLGIRDERATDDDGLGYNDGVAWGVESAARELNRVVETWTDSWVFECTECGKRWVDPPAPVGAHHCDWHGRGMPPEDSHGADVEVISKPCEEVGDD